MQIYANVATLPERKAVRASGRTYFEFRAAESSKGEDKDPTWYTVRVFDSAPELAKGDFVKVTGKLKQDVFTGRDGKPMGVLVVFAYNCERIAKPCQPHSTEGKPNATAPKTPIESRNADTRVRRISTETPSIEGRQDVDDSVDCSWLELAG